VAPRTTQQAEEPEQMEQEDQVTRPEDLGFRRGEIEVERVQVQPQVPDASGMVQIRMGRTIEEFTYGNPHVHYKLEEGKIYRVPVEIGNYLDSLGAVYH
jgi:hypothetical protein